MTKDVRIAPAGAKAIRYQVSLSLREKTLLTDYLLRYKHLTADELRELEAIAQKIEKSEQVS